MSKVSLCLCAGWQRAERAGEQGMERASGLSGAE